MKLIDFNIVEFDNFIRIYDLENLFDVVTDYRKNRVFNLNKTAYIQVDVDKLPVFICDHTMHWPIISYKIYGTTRLAWLLWKLNNVDAKNVFQAKQPKDEIKYLPQQYCDSIIADINDFEE